MWENLPFDGVRPATNELPRIRDILWYFARWIIFLGGTMMFLIIAVTIAILMR